MDKENKKVILILKILCTILFLGLVQGEKASAKQNLGILGQVAPELGLNDWIGKDGEKITPIKLSDYRGKYVYLYFFQDWCPGCQKYGFPALKKLSSTLSPDKIVFFGVQTVFEGAWTNTFAKLRKNQEKHEVFIPMAHDDGGSMQKRSILMGKYRSGGTPWTVLIDPNGRVIFNGFHINEDKLIHFIKNLKPQ